MPFIVAIISGFALGWLAGGDWRRLESIQLTRPLLLIVLFAMQGLSRGRFWGAGSEHWGLLVWACISVAMVLVVVMNRSQGLIVLASGVALNLLVVLLNGFMPVITGEPISADQTTGAFYVVSDTTAIAAWLGDVLQLNSLGQTYYLSAGDVLLTVGVAVLVVEAMTTATKDINGSSSLE